jgi:hypothetical protein
MFPHLGQRLTSCQVDLAKLAIEENMRNALDSNHDPDPCRVLRLRFNHRQVSYILLGYASQSTMIYTDVKPQISWFTSGNDFEKEHKIKNKVRECKAIKYDIFVIHVDMKILRLGYYKYFYLG